jgi:asparagine synthase (glutamine-hydrolysing)
MCGFAGIFFPSSQRSQVPSIEFIKSMTDSIAHRGPDGEGFHVEAQIGLGHRRLSIIDVATGQQPLFNEDKTIVTAFNGEIYNYKELANELKNVGHVFRTLSDTEVIVHAWEQWGSDCVKHFRGMFAFALWDRVKKTLFLARDHMGVKPLYWGQAQNGSVVFGSELKALMRHPLLSREIDPKAVDDYFAFGYVPDPKSILKNCFKLPPASTLLWTVGESKPTIAKYWQVKFDSDNHDSEAQTVEELRQRITESVKLRLISEVPIGAFLSGGVDSSVVVATMAHLSAEPVKTCSIGFDVSEFDELDYARRVAEQFKTDHFFRRVSVEQHEQIDRIAQIYDEPFADSSAIPTIQVCKMARERVTVALSGDAGDETFAGYSRYKSHLQVDRWRRRIPTGIRTTLVAALAALYPKIDWAPRIFRLKNVLSELASEPIAAYLDTAGAIRATEREKLYSQQFSNQLNGYKPVDQMIAVAQSGPTDTISMLQNLDYHFYLPGDINVKVDRASMSCGLESREPLMDYKLVEWAATISPTLKLKSGITKYILKKSYESTLPNDILYRPKMGFSVPLAHWFRGELGVTMQTRINSSQSQLSKYLRMDKVQEMLTMHKAGQRNWATPLWTILMLDASLRHISNAPVFSGSTDSI